MQSTKNQNAHQRSVRTTVSLPGSDYIDLEQIAARKKVSVAWVVRDAVERYLKAEAPLFHSGARAERAEESHTT